MRKYELGFVLVLVALVRQAVHVLLAGSARRCILLGPDHHEFILFVGSLDTHDRRDGDAAIRFFLQLTALQAFPAGQIPSLLWKTGKTTLRITF